MNLQTHFILRDLVRRSIGECTVSMDWMFLVLSLILSGYVLDGLNRKATALIPHTRSLTWFCSLLSHTKPEA